jgi:hypothetical protein
MLTCIPTDILLDTNVESYRMAEIHILARENYLTVINYTQVLIRIQNLVRCLPGVVEWVKIAYNFYRV